jgi:hypothetical protein
MSTGLIRIFTNNGFIVAADGLVQNIDKNNKRTGFLTDSMQKLFPIQEGNRELVYGITGSAAITDSETDATQFNFIQETANAVQVLSNARTKTLHEYVSRSADL